MSCETHICPRNVLIELRLGGQREVGVGRLRAIITPNIMKKITASILFGISIFLFSACTVKEPINNSNSNSQFKNLKMDEGLSKEVYSHPRYGRIVKDELLIDFHDEVKTTDALKFIESIPASVHDHIEHSNSYFVVLLESQSPQNFEHMILQLEEGNLVSTVIPNSVLTFN